MSIQDKAAALRALVFRETEVDPKCEVLVYALRGVSFKGGRVCPGFRAFYGEEAYKKLCSRIPREFSEAVEAVRFRLDHFNELRDGYYTEGLVFVDLDEKGRAYVHDPDTDGRVYLPSLAAHHPDAVYNLDFIPMDQIRVLEEVRYRSSYDVEDLAENIRRYGLLNPLVVFRDKKVYRLLAGYRRYYALKKLGWSAAPALVLNLPAERQNLIPLIENLFRSQPTPEEYARLLRVVLGEERHTTAYSLLRKLGAKERKEVVRMLRELGLEEEGHDTEEEEKEPSTGLRSIVSQLLTSPLERGRPPLDELAIENRLQAIEASLEDEGEASSASSLPSEDERSDGEALGFVELPVNLLNALAEYLGASTRESFRERFTDLVRAVVSSQIVILVSKEDADSARLIKALGGGVGVRVIRKGEATPNPAQSQPELK